MLSCLMILIARSILRKPAGSQLQAVWTQQLLVPWEVWKSKAVWYWQHLAHGLDKLTSISSPLGRNYKQTSPYHKILQSSLNLQSKSKTTFKILSLKDLIKGQTRIPHMKLQVIFFQR